MHNVLLTVRLLFVFKKEAETMQALYVLTILNIAMLLLNIWLRLDSEETLAEIKERSGFDETS